MRRTSAAGTLDPPEQMVCIDDTSRVAKSGCSIIAMSIVGTASM